MPDWRHCHLLCVSPFRAACRLRLKRHLPSKYRVENHPFPSLLTPLFKESIDYMPTCQETWPSRNSYRKPPIISLNKPNGHTSHHLPVLFSLNLTGMDQLISNYAFEHCRMVEHFSCLKFIDGFWTVHPLQVMLHICKMSDALIKTSD